VTVLGTATNITEYPQRHFVKKGTGTHCLTTAKVEVPKNNIPQVRHRQKCRYPVPFRTGVKKALLKNGFKVKRIRDLPSAQTFTFHNSTTIDICAVLGNYAAYGGNSVPKRP
jgi:hypothetical protein